LGNPAEYKIRKSFLSDDFGYELAVKWFGQEVVDDLPKYTKGKHEGKPMGLVKWIKVEKGGYDPMHYSTSGRLETRKGFILGKALLKTSWGVKWFNTNNGFKTQDSYKKFAPSNTLVAEKGETPFELWG
tara:strand:- start:254 stop:640 length:387 start_codon:yes stop_codon:yes gene_type:complete